MIKRSVAPNTLKAYLRVKAEVIWAHFLSDDCDVRIYADRNDLFMWKLDRFHKEEALCLFICYMSNTLKKSRCAIGAVMSALRFLFNACLQDISIFECAGLTASRKSLVERGRNAKSKSASTPTNFITSDMLAWMRHVVDSSLPLCLKQLIICIAIYLGFHFGYRVGEICISNGDDSHTIWNEDIIFETTKGDFINAVDAWKYNVSIIAVCLVILRSSKANQTGGGTHKSFPDTLLVRSSYLRIYLLGHKPNQKIQRKCSFSVLPLVLLKLMLDIIFDPVRSLP